MKKVFFFRKLFTEIKQNHRFLFQFFVWTSHFYSGSQTQSAGDNERYVGSLKKIGKYGWFDVWKWRGCGCHAIKTSQSFKSWLGASEIPNLVDQTFSGSNMRLLFRTKRGLELLFSETRKVRLNYGIMLFYQYFPPNPTYLQTANPYFFSSKGRGSNFACPYLIQRSTHKPVFHLIDSRRTGWLSLADWEHNYPAHGQTDVKAAARARNNLLNSIDFFPTRANWLNPFLCLLALPIPILSINRLVPTSQVGWLSRLDIRTKYELHIRTVKKRKLEIVTTLVISFVYIERSRRVGWSAGTWYGRGYLTDWLTKCVISDRESNVS